MYPVTKRPWTSVWRDADSRPLRDIRRLGLAQRLGQYHHLNIDWARFDLPNLAIFVPANFDRMDQLGRNAVSAPAQTPDTRWWIKEMHPRTFVVPKPPEIKSAHMSPTTQWAYIIWFGGAVTLLVLAGLLVIFTKLAEHIANHGFNFHFRRRRSSEWVRPTVRATAVPIHNIDPRTGGITAIAITPPTPPLRLDSIFENELPPPYPTVVNSDPNEDPPPPYSECCVTYSNTDEPRVHFYINQSINVPEETVKTNDTRQNKPDDQRDDDQRVANEENITETGVNNTDVNTLPVEIQQNEHERLPIV